MGIKFKIGTWEINETIIIKLWINSEGRGKKKRRWKKKNFVIKSGRVKKISRKL